MRARFIVLLAAVALLSVPLPARSQGQQPLEYVTYLFEFEVAEVVVNDPDFPTQSPVAEGDTGSGILRIADWATGYPYPSFPCAYVYSNVPGYKLQVDTAGGQFEVVNRRLVRVYNDCERKGLLYDYFDASGWSGIPYYSAWMAFVLSALGSEPFHDSQIPLVLDLDDFANRGFAMYYKWSNVPRWSFRAQLTSLKAAGPDWLLTDLIDGVEQLNLHHGIANSLDVKLQNAVKALDDLNDNNIVAAVGKLEAFINEVEAQAGDKIPAHAANDLIQATRAVVNALTR
jgi:hypothetical protein